MIREIRAEEVPRLRPFLEALAVYHNQVSLHHEGMYPAKNIDGMLETLAAELRMGSGAAAVLENGDGWQGFASIHKENVEGTIGFLFVAEEFRGKGLGRLLMDWAVAELEASGCQRIAVKVVAGNPAIHLYEAYGFQLNAQILWKKS